MLAVGVLQIRRITLSSVCWPLNFLDGLDTPTLCYHLLSELSISGRVLRSVHSVRQGADQPNVTFHQKWYLSYSSGKQDGTKQGTNECASNCTPAGVRAGVYILAEPLRAEILPRPILEAPVTQIALSTGIKRVGTARALARKQQSKCSTNLSD